jgi:hypothetical protein
MTSPFGRCVLALACTLTIALAAGACEYNDSNGHHHGGHHGNGGGKGVCYERVLNIDKKTGQTHYEDRAVPCPK